MPETVIAIAQEAPFRFDLDAFTATVRQRWPNARFVPATGRAASVTRGQWQIPDADSWPNQVLVEFDIEGQGLMLDSPEDELRAAVIAAATSVPDFPGDGSVILAEWATEFIALRPNMTAEEILAARA